MRCIEPWRRNVCCARSPWARGSVSSAIFGPNGDWISTSGADGKVRIWDVSTGELLRTMGDGARPILGHTLSPDGKRLVTAGEDGIARIWDIDTGQLLSTLSDHAGPVWGLNFSPDGTKLVTTSDDKTVKLRDSQSGEVLLTLPGSVRESPAQVSALMDDAWRLQTKRHP